MGTKARKMADTELRANSLRVRFERGVPEPADSEIFKFMKSKMKLNSDKLLSMYKDKNETSIIIKFKKEEDMRNTLSDLPGKMLFEYNKYDSTEVRLSSANAIVRYIRLFNLPPEIDDKEISVVMQRFGKIVRMVREKYGEETGFPIWTSVRGVYLELREGVEIPATIYIRNMRARVSYEGIINKCYMCGSKEHLKAECPEKKSVNDRLREHQGTSYSGILKGGERWVRQHQSKQGNTDSEGMIKLGQGLPKRLNTAQLQSDQSELGGEEKAEGRENSSVDEGQTAPDNGSESIPVTMGLAERGVDNVESNVDMVVAESDFTKVTGKRGRKQQRSGTNKEGTSDSDESASGKVHRERYTQPGNKSGTLSESLDRITRSKSKQRKISGSEKPITVVEGGSAALDCLSNDVDSI